VRETIALRIFPEEILPATTRQTSIIWRVDNKAALAHIRKEGGLKERRLLREAERILILLHSRQLRIIPAFIPSEENLGGCGIALPVGAGLASRRQRFLSDNYLVGNTPDRPLCVALIGANGAFHVLAGSGLTGSHRRPQHEVELFLKGKIDIEHQ
jgi:hypothetical protein